MKRSQLRSSNKKSADNGRFTRPIAPRRTLLPAEDGRSAWARMMRETFIGLVQHCGGIDVISDTRRMAARRVAALEAELVALEEHIASIRRRGKEPPTTLLQTYGALADRQRRLSEVLGWDRDAKNAKDVTLSDYLAHKRKQPVTIDADA